MGTYYLYTGAAWEDAGLTNGWAPHSVNSASLDPTVIDAYWAGGWGDNVSEKVRITWFHRDVTYEPIARSGFFYLINSLIGAMLGSNILPTDMPAMFREMEGRLLNEGRTRNFFKPSEMVEAYKQLKEDTNVSYQFQQLGSAYRQGWGGQSRRYEGGCGPFDRPSEDFRRPSDLVPAGCY